MLEKRKFPNSNQGDGVVFRKTSFKIIPISEMEGIVIVVTMLASYSNL